MEELKEEWKEISGYERLYFVSNTGRVMSSRGYIQNGWKHDKYGHRKIRLYKDNIASDFYLHRLVAIQFIKNELNKPYINHIDSNPSNNCAENLEWCNHLENMRHASANGRYSADGNLILNIETGVYYSSVKHAAESAGIKPNTLVYKLIGKRRNNTKFIQV